MPNPNYIDPLMLPSLNHDILPPEEAKRLAAAAQNGDLAARDRLVLDNQKMVVHYAVKQRGHGIDLDDLIQAGNVGLFRAIETYKPNRNARVSTWVVQWIRSAISLEFRRHSRIVRMPAAHSDSRVKREKHTPIISINASNDQIAAKPLKNLRASEELVARVEARRAQVTAGAKHVLTLRYGLDRGHPRTIYEVAAILHCSPLEVRKRECKALRQIGAM